MAKKKRKTHNTSNQTEQPHGAMIRTLELMAKHHILFWLLVFPPVAFYKAIKYKIVHKAIIIVVLIPIIILVFYFGYLALNPTYLADYSVTEYMEEHDYGTVRDAEYIGKYQDYHMSEVITTKGFFAVYFNYDEDDNFYVDTIVEYYTQIQNDLIYNEFKSVYQSENANQLLSQINPSIIKFLTQNDGYGEIKGLVEQYENSQVIKTTKGKYQFKYQYYETITIRKYNPDDDSYSDVMNRDYIIKMKDDFAKALNGSEIIPMYYEIDEITAYVITANQIYYDFTNFCGNHYRIVKFNNGQMKLQRIVEECPIPQDKLAEAWAEYQNSKRENVANE